MSRLGPIDPENMSPAQKKAHDAIAAGPRGSVRGPFAALLHNPGVADAVHHSNTDGRKQAVKMPTGEKLAWLASHDMLPLAARADVLVFRTPPLPEALELTGPVEVHLYVSSSAQDTDFTAKLVDEYPSSSDYPDGFALNLCDAIVRMRYRNGRRVAELIEPNSIYEITVGPLVTSNLFAVGHRIRLDVSSSSAPQFDVNPNTGGPLGLDHGSVIARNTVYHDRARPSRVRISVVSA